MDEDYWEAVRTLRLRFADLLDTLDPEEWEHESLCRGWRVRDVAGHVGLVPRVTSAQLLAAMPRAGFNLHKVNTLLARRAGSAPTADIVRTVREHAADQTTARLLDTRDALFDVIVHSQDVAVPLGRAFDVPPEQVREGLHRVWDELDWPFHARRRLAGHRLVADDVEWEVGDGPEVRGSALSLLMLLTGRTSTVRGDLSGAGVGSLPA